MDNLFKKIKYFFLAKKEKDIKTKFVNGTTKHVLGVGSDLTINAQTQQLVEQVRQNVADIVKKTACDANALLDYVKVSKTPVYKIKNADKLLNLINECEGLIYEKRGIEGLYLSIITGQGFKFKTEPMFILRDGIIDNYSMLYHFYNWYSMKSGLAGFDYEVQENFKKMIISDTDSFIKRLNLHQTIALKEAIARDKEATDFVLEYSKSKDGTKNVLDKLQKEGSANI